MDLFNSLIKRTEEVISDNTKTVHNFDSHRLWTDVGYNQVILQKDTAFELDGVGFTLVTTEDINDEVVVVGDELKNISSNTKFARVAIVQIEDEDDAQKLHDTIKKAEYVKYNCYPDGYMMRSASSSHKESVRVSKTAIKNNISFESVGNLFISKYKEIAQVKGVRVIFVSTDVVDYTALQEIAEKTREITNTLNKVMDNLEFDCANCNLKEICDEVEGMRELHFKSSKGEN